ncbi:NAD(P)-dependent oxidoreductase [Dyadobacter psychrotolerans]|uniref:D-2-hydroxyacid dehydrogenase n=1 Tax=Dyadobacter psychrotolerans TaxID=2541721 RepID=A0A4R5DE35_9BACT|nr:NAD(P)-dependent oxidoreductase [Dyadobacter psychrotolerans]TDE12122.1 D-2-hydroxyacid dehydrogenase [Dyadobacter psychrotolerans]
MKIFVFAELSGESRSALKKRLPKEAEITFNSEISKGEIKEALKSAEILIGNPPADLLKDFPSGLKFWQLENVGFEQYKDIKFKGTVANVGDMSAIPCAETIVSGILGFYRGVHSMVRNQIEKRWVGEEISNDLQILGEKKVIILGSGAIGEHIKKILTAFGCEVQMTAKSDPDADIHSFEDLLKQLPETDLVINTLPGNLENYVSADFFEAVKEGSLYASIGRGNTTDEAALIKTLKNGKLAGAVLDVTEKEPLPKGNKLWEMENVILTQHTGAGHKDRDRDKVEKFASNIDKFLKKKKIEDEVKLSDGY